MAAKQLLVYGELRQILVYLGYEFDEILEVGLEVICELGICQSILRTITSDLHRELF